MKRHLIVWPLATAALALASGALAQSAKGQAERLTHNEPLFRTLDRNKDGLLDLSEFSQLSLQARTDPGAKDSASAGGGSSAPPSDLFRQINRNGDGYLSEEELRNARVPRGSGWIASDRDNNGRITRSEFTAIR